MEFKAKTMENFYADKDKLLEKQVENDESLLDVVNDDIINL